MVGCQVLCGLGLLDEDRSSGEVMQRLMGRGGAGGAEMAEDPLFSFSVFCQLRVCRGRWLHAGPLRASEGLHSTPLGYGGSAGVEVGDRKPSVERDLGKETVSYAGRCVCSSSHSAVCGPLIQYGPTHFS